MKVAAVLTAALCVPFAAGAQSFNIDFGPASSKPSASYGAAGAPGVWNAIGVLPSYQRAPLVGLDGSASAAQIYMYAGTQILDVDVPETAGDDAALLDDMLIGFNDPYDVCIWVEGLVNDEYEVLVYGMTPGEPERQCRVRVDYGSPGPQMVGGAWPGMQIDTVTFGRHIVSIGNGWIGLHSGLYQGYFQSGINGIQIRPRSATGVEPWSGAARVLGAFPNPARGRQDIEVNAPEQAGALEILDAAGRLVWRQALGSAAAGRRVVPWDGRDLYGRLVPAAAYFVRFEASERKAPTVKLIRID